MLDLFIELLVSVLENKARPVSELQWGEEVARLAAPGPFIPAIIKNGQPPELPSITPPAPSKAPEDGSEAPPAMVSPFLGTEINQSMFDLISLGALGCCSS